MANPTSNFGWQMPTSTDLVTDLPADFEIFGQAVDTALAELKGGTTGQVLSKTSNTDMDFTWIAAVAGSPYVAGKNGVLNSNYSVWQRGTSFTNCSSIYTADRWFAFTNGVTTGRTLTRQTTSDTTNLPFIQYCLRFQRDSGNAVTSNMTISQPFESSNSTLYAGRTVVFSFYARKGANYSPTSSLLGVFLITGTGTDQNQQTPGYTGQATPVNSSATLTTTWQRFTFTGTVASTATEICPVFVMSPTGTAGAAEYFENTGVQKEISTSVTAYSPNAATLQGEIDACQRYFYQFVLGATKSIGIGVYDTASIAYASLDFPVTMRTTPTLSATTGTGYYRFQRLGATDDFNSFTMEAAHTNGTWLYNSTEMSGTAGDAGVMKTQDAAASLAFSAEI